MSDKDIKTIAEKAIKNDDPVRKAFKFVVEVLIITLVVVVVLSLRSRESAVKICKAADTRVAIIANGQFTLAKRVGGRNDPGDKESADLYRAVGESVVLNMILPKRKVDPLIVSETRRMETKLPSGQRKITIEVTPRAKRLIQEACEDANPSVIPGF